MGGETEEKISGWTVDTLKEYLLEKIDSSSRLQDSKWESQKAHNIAANEWRDTIGDLKRDFVPRTEHAALENRYAADQLAIARTLSQTGGEKLGARENRESSMSTIILIATVAGTISGIIMTVVMTMVKATGHA